MRLLDVSSNNHPNNDPIDWNVVAEQYDAVYIKLGQGVSYINPYWLGDTAQAKNAGMKVGHYWFYDETTTAENQAAIFKDMLPKDDDLIPFLDYEIGTPNKSVVEAFTTTLPTCGVYMDRNFSAQLSEVAPLWLAFPGWSESDPVGSRVVIIQTGTTTVAGITGNVDVDQVLDQNKIEVSMITDTSGSDPTDFVNPPDSTDAPIEGTSPTTTLNAPVVACRATTSGQGYWLVGADGGVFCFGDAKDYGNIPGLIEQKKIAGLNRPVCDIMAYDNNGYALVCEDGGVFSFGSFQFKGSI